MLDKIEQHPHNNAIRILEYVSMNEIICPHCDKAFKVDEAGYANILKQVHDREFESQLNERLTQVEKDQVSALKLVEKDAESALQALKSAKDIEVERLLSQIREKESSVQATVDQAVREIERERDTLQNDLKNAHLEKQNSENVLKDKYKTQIRDRDDAIERLKDMKAKLSTKMVGETLEQHCEIEFNKLRSTAFQTAFFEKDNDAREGSKGDYIFKDHDQDGTEIVSIMFEMKNEKSQARTRTPDFRGKHLAKIVIFYLLA